MKYIYILLIVCVFAINAGAFLNGAWLNDGVAPYAYPYTTYSTVSAEVEAVFENGETYQGPVLIYEQGFYVAYGDNQRDFILLEPGLFIEKKGRSKVKFVLPDGHVIVGKTAGRISGQRLYLRENTPCPRRSFVLIFSNKYNYEPNIINIKSLKIEKISAITESGEKNESNTLFE